MTLFSLKKKGILISSKFVPETKVGFLNGSLEARFLFLFSFAKKSPVRWWLANVLSMLVGSCGWRCMAKPP